jgi:amino acid permease
MAKKTSVNNTNEDEYNFSVVNKLRDELFEYRIDIKAYKRSLNAIIAAGTILISVIAFFGYSKIENIEKTIMNRANERLAITDSLLKKSIRQGWTR